jgi:malate permease and related proteins
MILINSMQSVLTILIIILIGYVLAAKGWFDEKTSSLFSKIVVNVSLPALMISNLMTTFDKDKLYSLSIGLVAPFVIMIISYILSFLLGNLLKVERSKRGVFCALFAFSNTIFIGLPINQGLFGDKAVPYVLLYYIANTTLFWTLGAYGISTDDFSKENKNKLSAFFSINTLKRIFSPPLLGFITALILIILGIQLPSFIMDTCKYIGNLTTPLSMFFIGIVIHSVNLKDLKFNRETFLILFGRFVFSPVLALILLSYFPVDNILMKKVFVVQTSLPVMTQISIVAKAYNSDHKFAAIMATLTTAASLIIIPVYMYIMNLIW